MGRRAAERNKCSTLRGCRGSPRSREKPWREHSSEQRSTSRDEPRQSTFRLPDGGRVGRATPRPRWPRLCMASLGSYGNGQTSANHVFGQAEAKHEQWPQKNTRYGPLPRSPIHPSQVIGNKLGHRWSAFLWYMSRLPSRSSC